MNGWRRGARRRGIEEDVKIEGMSFLKAYIARTPYVNASITTSYVDMWGYFHLTFEFEYFYCRYFTFHPSLISYSPLVSVHVQSFLSLELVNASVLYCLCEVNEYLSILFVHFCGNRNNRNKEEVGLI